MLIINNDDVSKLLTMADCIRVQEEAFKKIPIGGAIHRPRIDHLYAVRARGRLLPLEHDGRRERRLHGDPHEVRRHQSGRAMRTATGRKKNTACEPGTYCGIIYLLSTRNGEPLAFINDGVLQHMRVGGGAGIGAKWLAREDSHVVGMLGSGGMARTFLEAFTCVRDISLCKVYSPNAKRREDYAEEMSKKLGIEVRAVISAREAVRGVDILSSCTDSMKPVYDAEWIEKGMHVTNLGRREMPDAAAGKVRRRRAPGRGRPANAPDRALPGRARTVAGRLYRRLARKR